MSLQLWGVYLSAVVLLCLTPGPNSLLAITNGVRYGARKTLLSTLGCAAGLTMLIGLSLSGLGLILATSAVAFEVIRWCGAAYLLYLGVKLLRSNPEQAASTDSVRASSYPAPTRLFLQGFWVVTLNPKVLLFFVAFLPQFYVPQAPVALQFAVLAGTFVAVEVALEIVLAISAGKLASVVNSHRGRRTLDRVAGSMFAAAGIYLLIAERPR